MTLWNADLAELSEIELRQMADALAARGDAADAARETEELLVMLRQWKIRADVRVARLADVWRAVHRDSSEKSILDALASYRGEPTP